MRLPNADDAQVEFEKLRYYLISETHPIGRSKGRFFRSIGFDESRLAVLKHGLIAIARTEDIVEAVASPHGTKYIVDGSIATPSGEQVRLRTVWIVDKGQDNPRFVTAYPM
jgi:hypothetical protein